MRGLATITICYLLIPACQSEDIGAKIAIDKLSADNRRSAEAMPVEKIFSHKTGVRNFQEINLTMSSLTGIDHRAVGGVYNTVSSMLPLDNSADAFHPPVQVAVFRLASTYCEKLLNNNEARAKLFPNINFDAPPSEALAINKRNDVATAFVNKLWGRAAAVQVPVAESVAKLTRYMGEALGESRASDSYIASNIEPMRNTKEVLFTVCNAMLASAAVMFH